MSNKNRNVLYTGVTNNLYRRVIEHKSGSGSVFTRKYNCSDLVYFEEFDDIEAAIDREKQIKSYSRKRKDGLILAFNPSQEDLFNGLMPMVEE